MLCSACSQPLDNGTSGVGERRVRTLYTKFPHKVVERMKRDSVRVRLQPNAVDQLQQYTESVHAACGQTQTKKVVSGHTQVFLSRSPRSGRVEPRRRCLATQARRETESWPLPRGPPEIPCVNGPDRTRRVRRENVCILVDPEVYYLLHPSTHAWPCGERWLNPINTRLILSLGVLSTTPSRTHHTHDMILQQYKKWSKSTNVSLHDMIIQQYNK